MLEKPSGWWKVYFALYAFLTVGNTIGILYDHSTVYSYYHVLMAFDESFALRYQLNVVSAFVNLLCLVPIGCYVFVKRFLNKYFWYILFFVRVIFDFCGHSYEFQYLKSVLMTDLWIGLWSLFFPACVLVPSYIAHFLFTFPGFDHGVVQKFFRKIVKDRINTGNNNQN